MLFAKILHNKKFMSSRREDAARETMTLQIDRRSRLVEQTISVRDGAFVGGF
jgi:hypothetical protein